MPLISECAAAILAGNRDFQKIYHAVYDVIRSGEADSMEAAQAEIAALGQAVRGDPKRLQQRDEAAEPATLLADAAGARPAFAEVVRCLSEATGARRRAHIPNQMARRAITSAAQLRELDGAWRRCRRSWATRWPSP